MNYEIFLNLKALLAFLLFLIILYVILNLVLAKFHKGKLLSLIIALIISVEVLSFIVRPFVFEFFDSSEEILEVLNRQYNKGDKAIKLISYLEKSWAKCKFQTNDQGIIGLYYNCYYTTSLISINPSIAYTITIQVDNNDVITNVKAYKAPTADFVI